MKPDPRIAEMQRRLQRWLPSRSAAGGSAPSGRLEDLEADISELQSEFEALFPNGDSTQDVFEALREQAVFRTVLDSVMEGVIVADMKGRLLIFNPAARKLMGSEPRDMDPANWSATYGLFRSDGKTLYLAGEDPLSRSLQGESVTGEEMVVRTRARPADLYVLSTSRPLRDKDGQQIGGVVVFHDVTESKQVEKELRRARETAEENSRAKSEFLANMSHEIRTPLTAVLGFTDLLMDPHLNESDKLNYIQAVRRNGEHLLALINDVLDLSKIQAKKMTVERVECSLHQLLHEAASVMQVRAAEKGLDFNVTYETPIPARIQCDPMRLRQILLNLLGNAIKFTPQGKVTLTVRCLDLESSTSRLEMEVSDTGIGMSESELGNMFQSFHQANLSTTRQYGGTGLGLSICHSLAEALGGEIKVSSVLGEGSSFTLVLHLSIDPNAEMVTEHGMIGEELDAETTFAAGSEQLAGRILLAEDGIDNQFLISTILRRQGLEVEIAENGEIAVQEALTALEQNSPYDLILMDMQMPKLDGYGAATKLRSKGYSGAMVALTAHAMSGERERCIRAGCDDYLTKPIARGVLLATVAAHLHRARGGQAEPDLIAERPGEPHSAQSDEPLYSSYADDPEMDDLVAGFVERMPGQIQDLKSAQAERDLESLRRLAHQLKGAAGGYGFMPLSELAGTLETACRGATDMAQVELSLNSLIAICERVRLSQDGEPDNV